MKKPHIRSEKSEVSGMQLDSFSRCHFSSVRTYLIPKLNILHALLNVSKEFIKNI